MANEKEHPVHEDHPGRGRGTPGHPDVGRGNQPDKPGNGPSEQPDESEPHPEHPIVEPEPPTPSQLPA